MKMYQLDYVFSMVCGKPHSILHVYIWS